MPHQTGHTDHVGVRDIDRHVQVDLLADDRMDIENEMFTRVVYEQVRKAVLELDDGHRTITHMVLFGGYTREEVGRIARLNQSLVDGILEEAFAQLRDKLRPVLFS